jgi:hypothetical protein
MERREPKPEGHQMLVVANDCRFLDTVENGEWTTRMIGARNALRAGVYDITGAAGPARHLSTKTYEGNVLHQDKKHVYQIHTNDKGKPEVVKHDRALFQSVPEPGALLRVDYVRGQGQVASHERGLER